MEEENNRTMKINRQTQQLRQCMNEWMDEWTFATKRVVNKIFQKADEA